MFEVLNELHMPQHDFLSNILCCSWGSSFRNGGGAGRRGRQEGQWGRGGKEGPVAALGDTEYDSGGRLQNDPGRRDGFIFSGHEGGYNDIRLSGRGAQVGDVPQKFPNSRF